MVYTLNYLIFLEYFYNHARYYSCLYRLLQSKQDKTKPAVRQGRKATGL